MKLPDYLENEVLSSRITLLKDSIGILHKNPETDHFVSLALKVLRETSNIIKKSAVTKDETAKDGFWVAADKAIRDISEDISLFFMFQNSIDNKKWKSLANFSNRCSEYMGLKKNPSVVLYGSSNFSASGPPNATGISRIDEDSYSLVVIDHSLDALLWPSVVHEISHLLPLIDDNVDNLYYKSGLSKSVEIDEGVSKLVEAVCDSLATTIIGPAYPLSFYSQYYQTFGQNRSKTHPTDEFRMKLMIETLRKNNLEDYAKNVDELLSDRSGESWNDDILTNYIDNIISQTLKMVPKKPNATFRENISFEDFQHDPPGSIYSLFNEGWSLVAFDYKRYPKVYKDVSKKIFNALKRDAMPLYATA